MKKKLFFLCTMLAFSASLGSTTKECITKTDDTVNEVNVGGKQGRLDAKVIPDRYIDCPWCGHPTLLNKSDPIHYCGHCGRDIDSVSERKKCPWCNRDNYFGIGENSELCKYCKCGFNSTTTINFKATYELNGVESPLIGNPIMLFTSLASLGLPGFAFSGSPVVPISVSVTDKYGNGTFSINSFSGPTLDLYLCILASDSNLTLKTEWDPHVGYGTFNTNYDQWYPRIGKNGSESNGYTYENPCMYRHIKITKGKNNSIPKVTVNFHKYDSKDYDYDSFSMLFYIGQMVMRAKEFATYCGVTPNPVNVLYTDKEHHNCNCSFYYDSEKTIYLRFNSPNNAKKSGWDYMPDAIMHEYGHHLENQLDIIYEDWTGSHNPGHAVNAEFAWMEAWPTVFGKLAQNFAMDKAPLITFGYEYGGYYYGRKKSKSDGYNLGYNIKYTDANDQVEEAVQQILWDLFDYSQDGYESFDQFAFNYNDWFFITTREKTYTIKNLYDNLIHYYPQFEYLVKPLFAYHGITY